MRLVSETWIFIRELAEKRGAIWQLARQDFVNRTIGSALGFFWTFIQPLVMTLIMWWVFTRVFHIPHVEGAPYICWFIVGMAAWTFFAEALGQTTGVFQEYTYLVKKVQFRIAVLPLVKLLSALAVHGLFLLIVLVVVVGSGLPVSWYWLQTLYYTLALGVLLLGLGWIASSLNVFVRDVTHVVGVLLQFGFWLTPVFWDARRFAPQHVRWLKLNPLYYIVDGYRNSLLGQTPFWEDGLWTAYYWGATLLILGAGIALFRRLKPHFADVL